MPAFDCFISYSHSADDDIAPALSSALQRFNKPWHRRRALRVFRDRAQLAPTHRLWSTILDALEGSRFFVLLASPGAARSEGVQREAEHWLQRHGTEGLLIVLTEGELRWRDDPPGFAQEESSALPPPLLRAFAEEPLHLDLRWALGREGLSLRDPRFLDAIAELAAAIHGRPKEDLIGEDQAQHRRTRRAISAAVVALTALTVTSVAAAVVAVAQRNVAQAQRRVALSRQLAAQVTTILAQSPERQSLALLLALEASRLEPSGEAALALRAALGLSPPLLASLEAEEPHGMLEGVQEVAFSPDGRQLAAALDNGRADIRDPVGGGRAAVLAHNPTGSVTVQDDGSGYNESVTALAFSPDGTLVATAGNDSTARIWRVSEGEELHRMKHAGRVRTLAFDPAGTHLATGDDAGVVHLWRVASGQETSTHRRGDQRVDEVAFSPDGRRLAALWEWGDVALFRVDSAAADQEQDAGAYSFGGLTFSRDGSLLATGHDGFAVVWDVETGREVRRFLHTDFADDLHFNSPTGLYDVAFGPDGRFLATASRDGTARVWSLETGQEVVRLSHAPYTVDHALFDRDGSTLITSAYRTVRAWEIPSGRELWRAVHDDEVWAVALAPDGRSVAVGDAGGAVRIWGLGGGDRLAVLDHPDDVIAVDVDPGGRFLATVDDRDDVRLWDRDGRLLAEATDREGWFNLRGIRMSQDGRTLALAGQAPNLTTLHVGNGLEGTYTAGYPDVDEGYVSRRFVAVTWKGRGASEVDSVRLWDPSAAQGGDVTLEIASGSRIRFDPSGSYLAVRSPDRTFRVWDLQGRREVGSTGVGSQVAVTSRSEAASRPSASGAEPRVSAFSLAPGGRLLALAVREPGEGPYETETALEVRELPSGAQVGRVRHPGDVRLMAFGGDGRILITATENDVYVWRTDDLAAEPVVLTHRDEVRARTLFGPGFHLDPTGRFVATLSGGRVRVWSSTDGRLLSELSDAGDILDFAFTPDGRQILTGSSSNQAVLWSWQAADLAVEGCRRVTRNLTREEWDRYLGGLPYRETCPGNAEAGAEADSGRSTP